MSDILIKIQQMTPEEGVAFLNQLFNPMRGEHVGSKFRKKTNNVVEEQQNKMEKEISRGFAGSVVTASGWALIHPGVEKTRCKGC